MRLDSSQIEVLDEAMVGVLRQKSGAERLRIADRLFAFARDGIRSTLRAQHPEWDERRINLETARRLSHGAV